MAKYKLTEKAYIKRTPKADFEELLEAGEEIEYEGIPGFHMSPLDDSAKAAVAKYKPQPIGVIDKLPMHLS